MPPKPKLEFRLVCAQYGQRGHGTHAYSMPTDKKKREQKIIDANHHSEMLAADADRSARSHSYFAGEAPWKIQVREVGKWEDEK